MRNTSSPGVSSRAFLQGAAAIDAVTTVNMRTRTANAAEFTINWGLPQPPIHPEFIRAKEAADKIKAETNGQVVLQVFPSNQLGADMDMLSQVRSGALPMANLASSIVSTFV